MKVIGQIIGIICLYLLSQGCGLSQSDDVVGPWGIRGDLPIAGDFNGDHVNDDVDVFRPSERNWYFDYFRGFRLSSSILSLQKTLLIFPHIHSN